MSEKIKALLRHSEKFRRYIFSKENNFKRSYNLIKAIINWKIFHPIKLKTYPITLTICTGNICNLSCKLCPVGLKQEGRKQGFMKFEDFKKIIDETGKYLYELYLFNWGEPLLNKDIFKMISYAKKYNIKVIISSNLMIFNEEIANNLINSGLDSLIVSLDGASNKSVSKYQKGCSFNNVFDNMKNLIKIREKLGKKNPHIQWKFVVNKHNEKEIELAKSLTEKNKIDELSFDFMIPNMGTYVLRDEEQCFEEMADWNPKNEKYSIFNYKTKKKKDYVPGCNWLWLMSSINWNGSVSPCCSIWFEKFDVGNCLDSPFMEVWNNKSYQNSRKAILGKKIDQFSICKVCKKNNAQI